jgi:acetyl esterase/lipase
MSAVTRRTLGLFAGASLAAAAGATRAYGADAAVTSTPAGFDPLPYVNPEFRPFAKVILPMMKGGGALDAQTLPGARRQAPKLPPLAQPSCSEQMIPGPAGAPPVRIYVINAGKTAAQRPAILHTHGGGFVMGDAKAAIRNLQEIAVALDCVIVTVDYRLAPETSFPGSLEDNYAGLKWLQANAGELGVDPSRLAVMGDSAGGGHAAMLAIAARDRGEIPLAYQALIYPMLDDRTGGARKKPPYMGALIWTAGSNQFAWSSFLGVPAGSARVPYGSVPARVDNLRGLPPAFIGVGSIDLFFDEDLEYARRLVDVGIPVTLNVVPGGFHGFDGVPGSSLAKQFKTALISALRAGLAPRA